MLRRAKCPGRLPAATPSVDPWLPENARRGSWQLAQLVPGGVDRVSSKKMARPSTSRAVGGAFGRTTGATPGFVTVTGIGIGRGAGAEADPTVAGAPASGAPAV